MKIGDLVAFRRGCFEVLEEQMGIIVDGPHRCTSDDQPAVSYTVVWFDPIPGSSPDLVLRYFDFNLEVLSESR